MSSIKFELEGISVSSQDWPYWKFTCAKREESFLFHITRVEQHKYARLVNIPLLFSFYLRRRMQAFPNFTQHENSVHATWDVEKKLDQIINHIP